MSCRNYCSVGRSDCRRQYCTSKPGLAPCSVHDGDGHGMGGPHKAADTAIWLQVGIGHGALVFHTQHIIPWLQYPLVYKQPQRYSTSRPRLACAPTTRQITSMQKCTDFSSSPQCTGEGKCPCNPPCKEDSVEAVASWEDHLYPDLAS